MAGDRQIPSLTNLVQEVGINVEYLDEACSDDPLIVTQIARLCLDWEVIATALGLSEAQIRAIREENSREEMRRVRVVTKWKESTRNPTTYRTVVEAFLACDRVQPARKICDIIKDQKAISSSEQHTVAPLHQSASVPEASTSQSAGSMSLQPTDPSISIRNIKRRLERKFSCVQIGLMNSNGVTLKGLTQCVATLPSFRSETPTLLKATSVEEFFHELKNYCSTWNPDILEDLVDELGDEETKERLSEFLQEYEKIKLKDLIGNFKDSQCMPPGYKELELKLGDNWCEKTLTDLKELKERMSLKHWLLKVINGGSITVTYLVPNSETLHLLLEEYCQSRNVLKMSMGGNLLFEHEDSILVEEMSRDSKPGIAVGDTEDMETITLKTSVFQSMLETTAEDIMNVFVSKRHEYDIVKVKGCILAELNELKQSLLLSVKGPPICTTTTTGTDFTPSVEMEVEARYSTVTHEDLETVIRDQDIEDSKGLGTKERKRSRSASSDSNEPLHKIPCYEVKREPIEVSDMDVNITSESMSIKESMPHTPKISPTNDKCGGEGISGVDTPTILKSDKTQTTATKATYSQDYGTANPKFQQKQKAPASKLSLKEPVILVNRSSVSPKKIGDTSIPRDYTHIISSRPDLPRRTPLKKKADKKKHGIPTNDAKPTRRTRCSVKEKHLCPVCSLPDCGECTSCRNKGKSHNACVKKPLSKCRKITGVIIDHDDSGPTTESPDITSDVHDPKLTQQTISKFICRQPPHASQSSTDQPHSEAEHSTTEKEDFHSQLDKMLEDKYVDILAAKCGVFGPPGSGKSHFKAITTAKKRPTGGRQSTAIATDAEQVSPAIDVTLDFDDELVEMHPNADGSKVRWFATDNKKLALLVANTMYDRKNPMSLSVDKRRKLSKTRKKILENMEKLMRRNLKRNPKSLKGMRLIYLVDTGGQPQFQEIMPIFVRSSSVHFLVQKLNESLDDCPRFDYEINGMKYSVPEEMLVSNRVYLRQSLRTISSCSFGRNDDSLIGRRIKKPRFAVIGMFKDQCTDLEDKQGAVNNCIKPYTESKCVAFTQSRHTEKPIFAIDGSEKGWSTNGEVVDDIHSQIENFTDELKVKIPIRWFLFLNLLTEESKEKSFLTLESCYKLARDEDLMMDKEDVHEALSFFDELNLILHFPKVSPVGNIVFILPSFLLKKVSEVIVQSFDCDSPKSELTPRERLAFRMTGIIEKSTLMKVKSIQKGFNDEFTQEKFFLLLEKLCIAATFPSDRLFLPSALPLEQDGINSEFLRRIIQQMKITKVEPLIISFSDGYSPRGLFCASAAYLANLPTWEIESKNCTLQRKRNLIEFEIYDRSQESEAVPLGNVIIIDRTSRIKVYSSCGREHLCDIRRTINKALWNAAANCLNYSPQNISISIGFSCQINCGKEKPHGTAVQDRDDPQWYMKCTKNRSKHAVKLNEKQLPWFSSTPAAEVNTTRPALTLALLMDEVATKTNEWEMIALHLDIDQVSIECIDRQERGNIKRCFYKIFEKWQKQQKPPFRWEEVIDALISPSVDEKALAKQLKEKYLK